MSVLESIPLSLLELATVPQGADIPQTLQHMLEHARHADQLGFKRLWLAEHHNMAGIASSATAVLVGQVAAHTRQLRVGSGGIMLPNHPPLVIAEQFGTLASLYPDRIDLGLGRAPGTDAITSRALRRDERRADHFPAEVAELQRLLGKSTGGHAVHAYPGSDTKVPIWLLGSSLFSAQLAAHRGLPYAFAAHFAPRYLHEALALYRREFQPSEQLAKPYAIATLPLIAAATDQQAQYLATSSQQRVIALMTGQPLFLPPPTRNMDALWDLPMQAQVQSFLAMAVVGGPATLAFKLASLVQELEVDELMFTNDIYDRQQRLDALDIVMAATRG
ncbi:LLM class flavin-dependent oxidoreductase [Oceanobacter sp. 3_MG-2023]|uniref:LLM class flavin-dependent oxidoreductase n=1 Tax=Oceanobacter sp. 3_MG-2023 TaxID=3062622 RepID=UPI0027331865|nr:LLM class flavin-dependent oxidoreductase [Oceanobacter sp. 3_MG-2023]MDP2505542.1 LLM class flavin-dependent oxidoreductase [Oceanobacter sp. 3_MG-2023]